MQSQAFWDKMNLYEQKGIPFLFFIDFEMENPKLFKLADINPNNLLFDVNNSRNFDYPEQSNSELIFEKTPVSFENYKSVFTKSMEHLRYGNSYLLNLTFPTPITTNYKLKDFFYRSQAKYKIWLKDEFVVFSPEIFVKIAKAKIYSYPMKGTINASVPDSEQVLLNNKKEIAEHATIVDLIRNDLNRISSNVRVEKFRYIDRIKGHDKDILQVSSEIVGDLTADYLNRLGEIMKTLLPAGSICGAPKKKTVEIILENETYSRGYYSGVMGIFDGENLDSGVMIRYIEQTEKGLVFKSGGGITVNSKVEDEYQELIDKVYVPLV